MSPPASPAPIRAQVPASRGAGAALRNGAIFLAALALSCATIGARLPFPSVPGIAPKYRFFAERKDSYEALLVGSSRFFHQVIPAQLDAAVRAGTGKGMRTFNCGYDGMYPPESYFVARRLLALRPARLRWVFIELRGLNPRPDAGARSSQRMAYWHDWQHTMLAWRHVWTASLPRGERWSLLLEHGWHLLKNACNLGRGAELLQETLLAERSGSLTWERANGYDPEPAGVMSDAELARYLARVESLRKNLEPCSLSPPLFDAVRALIADIRAAGAEPIFVIPPTLNPQENFAGIPDGSALFAFNNPTRFPTLFDPLNHYDAWHLNARGAAEFTRLFAERFIAHRLGSEGAVQTPAPTSPR